METTISLSSESEYNEILRQAVAVLPWWNINKLISMLGDDDGAILYYSQQTIAKGWGRDLMVNAIKLEMHKSQTSSNRSNNFALLEQ